MSARKKTVILMTVFLFHSKADLSRGFYFHFTACTGDFFSVGASVLEQPQLPPQPATMAGFKRLAIAVQPCFWATFDKDRKNA